MIQDFLQQAVRKLIAAKKSGASSSWICYSPVVTHSGLTPGTLRIYTNQLGDMALSATLRFGNYQRLCLEFTAIEGSRPLYAAPFLFDCRRVFNKNSIYVHVARRFQLCFLHLRHALDREVKPLSHQNQIVPGRTICRQSL